MPVDYSENRFDFKVSPVLIDLTSYSGQSRLWAVLSHPCLGYVHMSPPCGTASRAREKPLSAALRAKNWPEPQPLRSEQHPLGIPELPETLPAQVSRVAKANKLYMLCSEICQYLCHRCVPWTLENPWRSLFWWIQPVVELTALDKVEDIIFAHCMHGGERDKYTRLRSYPAPAFRPLAATCDNKHTHKHWGASAPGRFYTADEAAFPELLCVRMSRIANDLVSHKFSPAVEPIISHRHQDETDTAEAPSPADVRSRTTRMPDDAPTVHVDRIAAAVQPRRNAGPALISEFRAVARLPVNANSVTQAAALIGKSPPCWGTSRLPKGAKILSLISNGGDSGRDHFLEIGIPWSPQEFVEKSLSLEHPYSAVSVEDDILRSAFTTLTGSLAAARHARDQALDHWSRRAAALDPLESKIKASVHEDVRPSIASKRLLLFREMLESIDFPHADKLIHTMAKGFPLAGDIEKTGIFPEMHRPATSTLEDLWRTAPEVQRQVTRTIGASTDPELDEAVTDTTRDEVTRGWLRGPFTAAELTERHGLWIPARRFGIRQGLSTRVIDDFSESGQNLTVGASEKVNPGGVDVLANLARGVLSIVDPDTRVVSARLSDGSLLQAPLHGDWGVPEATTLLGKVWDLSKAYRQLSRSPSHASIAIVATFNSRSRKVELYEQLVLPFGSTASVYNFNWVARALQKLLVRGFGIIVTHYFDDYPTLEYKALADHTQTTIDAFFELLGWSTKEQKPFSDRFDALGVVCVLSSSSEGLVRFENKMGRVEEISGTVDGLVERGFVRRAEARSIRGRVQFARGQTFGRCGAVALKALGEIADGTKASPVLDPRTRSALSWLVLMLRSARPREIRVRIEEPVLLYVDGACEEARERDGVPFVTIGAVLFDAARPDVGPCYFGVEVGAPVVAMWMGARRDKTQVIGQAELLPVLLAKTTWPDRFANRANITFIDNDSARFGLIRGYSPILDSSRIINESWLADARLGAASWFSRVPSASNIADAPSRLDFKEVSAYPGATYHNVSLPSSWGSGDVWEVLHARLSSDFSE